MKIILNEQKFSSLLDTILNESSLKKGHPLFRKIEMAKNSLKKLLANNGVLMTNIENEKDYLVYEIASLTNEIGKRFCICQLVKDGDARGLISIKPLEIFKIKMY